MASTGVAITNPLVLYRSLLATQRIRPDPAQHRLALHLQKLYDRLIDYEPSVEYSQRLQQLGRTIEGSQSNATIPTPGNTNRFGRRGVWTSLLAQKERRDSLALTRVLTSHEEAMQLQSPKGLMLHGEVGTGKSMLIDLFQDCLPHRKKRRWHFNTFMLDTISRLEHVRRSRALLAGSGAAPDEYSLLLVARDLIQTSPILFLDEFQMPDRVASKMLSNLMTSFFQLGGVLIATSNRMPEELAKAAGMEFSAGRRRDAGPGQMGEFAAFLEVLKARCEVWEMEGQKDYRKLEKEEGVGNTQAPASEQTSVSSIGSTARLTVMHDTTPTEPSAPSTLYLPKHYLIEPATPDATESFTSTLAALIGDAIQHPTPIPWTPTTHRVYGRTLHVPAQHAGVALFPFADLCSTALGPADFITLASTYHTLILTGIPVLRAAHKEEARRLITLLDALYEARCRLFVTAAAPPDSLFFPEYMRSHLPLETQEQHTPSPTDATHPETFSEIYQDLRAPFRPNISSYGGAALAPDALEDDPPLRMRRPGSAFTDERRPDFADLAGLTGADERFAVRRAESRVWEMCSRGWWERRGDVGEWWRPVEEGRRHWEGAGGSAAVQRDGVETGRESRIPPNVKILSEAERREEEQATQEVSPFRVLPDAPPRFGWQHAWGVVRWGKRAGAWGKGVEGLGEREQEKEKERRDREDKGS